MADEKKMEDPTGRAVGVFMNQDDAERARQALLQDQCCGDDIRMLQSSDAQQVDDSAKWFADTEEEINLYKRKLEAGGTVLSVPVGDEAALKTVHQVFKAHNAEIMTHFGQWVTKTKDLDQDD